MIVMKNGDVIGDHCHRAKVEGTENGTAQWYLCARKPKHSGRCKMVPVTPRTAGRRPVVGDAPRDPSASGEPGGGTT